MKIFIKILLTTTFLGGIYWVSDRAYSKTTSVRDTPAYIYYVNEVENEFVKEAVNKYGLMCYFSGGAMPYDVERVSIGFIKHAPYNLEETRTLLVTLVREYQKKINQHEKLRPFLREYPFPAERVGVSLAFRDENSKNYKDSIGLALNCSKGIFYEVNDEKTDRYVNIKKETFEEAEQLVTKKPN